MDGIKPLPRSEPKGSICLDSYQFLSWLIIFSARNGEPQTPQQLCRRRVLCGVQRFNPTQQPNFNPGQEVIIPGVIFCKQPHVGFFLKPPRKIEVKQWSKVVAKAASFDAERVVSTIFRAETMVHHDDQEAGRPLGESDLNLMIRGISGACDGHWWDY